MKHLILSYIMLLGLQILCSISVAQQQVSGRITDATDGKPLPYASVYIANTTVGSYSDDSGKYNVTIPGEGSYEIVASFVGYKSFFHKIDLPKPFYQIDIVLERNDKELNEVLIIPQKTYSQGDVILFWKMILGEKPSKNGMEVLNPEKVYFYKNKNKELQAFCDEPIEIVNHKTGYSIRYILQYFKYDYKNEITDYYGKPFFKELLPESELQKNNWENKRQKIYAVSITHFIRALYMDQLLQEGFYLARIDTLWKENTFISYSTPKHLEDSSFMLRSEIISLSDILQKEQNSIRVNIEDNLLLACFSKPIINTMISNLNSKLVSKGSRSVSIGTSNIDILIFYTSHKFPVIQLLPQLLFIYQDGTYTGKLQIREDPQNRISGLAKMLPLEYRKKE